MYPMYHSLYILMQCIFFVIVQCQANDISNFCYNSKLKGFRFDTTVLMNQSVSQMMDCIIVCVNKPCCRSINYKKTFLNESNCEMLHDVVYNTSEKVLERNSSYDHVYLLDPQKEYNANCFPNVRKDNINGSLIGTSCLDIKNKGLNKGDGKYLIDPDGEGQGNPFEVYCDMTSFGGGWTMCYTTESHVNIKTELTTTPEHGYRADCNNVPFTGVIFVDEETKQKAAFNKNGSAVTFSGNYDKMANASGLWTAQGVASKDFQYQMLICDTNFYKGLHFSGFTNDCYKQCGHWCADTSSSYFRTSAVPGVGFQGVAFNENGHKSISNRLISAGIR